MRQTLLVIAAICAFSVCAFGQYSSNTVRKVSSLPATCTATGGASASSPVFYQGVVYACTSTNTWTATASDATKLSLTGGALTGPVTSTSTYTGAVYDKGGAVYTTAAYSIPSDGTTDARASLNTLLNTTMSAGGEIYFTAGTYSVQSALTIPANVRVLFAPGALLKPADGITITFLGTLSNEARQIFTNATATHGTIDFTGNRQIENIYLEWWGAAPSASAATNTPAIQAAIVAAGSGRTNASGNTIYNRRLKFLGIYSINDELTVYHLIGFTWEGINKLTTGITQTVNNKRIIDGQSVSYGNFNNLRFVGTGTSTLPLINLDYDASQGVDLKTQQTTFRDCLFTSGYIGVQIAKSGGGAQGDNVRFEDCFASSFTEAAAQLGDSSHYAYNALGVQWVRGDIQNCPKYGLAAYGGNWIASGTTFENQTADGNNAPTQTGFDMYCVSAQRPCAMYDIITESLKIASGVGILHNVQQQGSLIKFYDTNGGSSQAGVAVLLGQYITGTYVGGDGKGYKVTVAGTLGGTGLLTATSGSTTTIVRSTSSFTVDAFIGYRVSILAGTGQYQYGVVTGNTSTTITCSAGWVTDYPGYTVVAADNTSQFVVEPGWNGGTVTSGTATLVVQDYSSIVGTSQDDIQNVYLQYGGKAEVTGSIRELVVNRTDWYNATFQNYLDAGKVRSSGIHVRRALGIQDIPWTAPGNSLTRASAVSLAEFGDDTIRFSGAFADPLAPGIGGSFLDVGISRGDGIGSTGTTATEQTSRNILGLEGTLGRKTPFGTNQAGTDLNLQGGLSTGSGAAGVINFWTGVSGGSGTAVGTGVKRWQFAAAGHLLGVTDNTYDIGANGATRPRTGYFGTSVVTPLVTATSITVGGGTAITKILTGSASLDFGATAAGACDSLTITVTGAADGDEVFLGIPAALATADSYQVFNGFVSASDQVTVKRCNPVNSVTALSNPSAATVRATVIHH